MFHITFLISCYPAKFILVGGLTESAVILMN